MKTNAVNHKERAHALLSASSSSRWLNCTPSAVLCDAEEDQTSEYAEEGTVAHELAELKLLSHKGKHDTAAFLNIYDSKYYSPEMEKYTDAYVDYVLEEKAQALSTDEAAILFTEMRVDYSAYAPEGFGTVDNAILANKVLNVIDFKYGAGVKVSAVDNSQLKLYGLGALDAFSFLYDVDTVRLHIHQPRLDHISTFELSVSDILNWGEEYVKERALKAFEGKGEQVPGDWCQFCKVSSRCAALAKELEQIAILDFEEPRLISDEDLLDIQSKSERMIKWLNSIDGYMLSEALTGKKWDGFKLVEGRGKRVITDEDKAEQVLMQQGFTEEDYIESKLSSLTKLEKLVGKKLFTEISKDFTERQAGKPTLVPLSDKRKEISLSSDFDDGYEDFDDLL